MNKASALRKFMPFISVLSVSILIILALGLLISAKKTALLQQSSGIQNAAAIEVDIVTLIVSPGLVQEKISLPGIAKPWKILDVAAEVKGKVLEKKISQGSRVKKGDLLAIIDPGDYQNSYHSALASFETAMANKKRVLALSDKNFITQSQRDDAIAAVKTAKAALNTARLNLERCTVKSPMSGITDLIHIEEGSFLSPGDPVCRIIEINKLKVEVGIPESDVDAVRKLSSFQVSFDALGGETRTGTAHYLHKTTSSSARLYTLEIRIENPDFKILPDMFARVSIVKQALPQGLAIPMYSLVTRDKETGVFIEKERTATFQPVEKSFIDGWNILITKGLRPGDHVVVVGHRMIEHGQKVNVTRTITHMEELYQ